MIKLSKILLLFLLSSFCMACNEDDSTDYNQTLPEAQASISLNTTHKIVSNPLGKIDILVMNTGGWKAKSNDTWLTLSASEGIGYKAIKVHYETNPSNDTRRGSITFTTADGTASQTLEIAQTEKTFTNPLAGIPDPWVIKHNDSYYLCKAGDGIYISKSNQLSVVNGTQRVWKTPVDSETEKPWNVANIWAPELHYIDGNWYVYYAAGRPRAEEGRYHQRSGVLRAKTDDPMGEWEDLGILYTGDNYTSGIVPSKDNTTWAIDLTTFVLNGQRYAVWSGLPDDISSEQMLYIAKMENPYTISSNRVAISRPDQSWELVNSKINEGTAFITSPDGKKAFIVYSCNGSWTKEYRLGYLMIDAGKDPMIASNWKKSDTEVFYRCDNTPLTAPTDGVNGVGHCSFTKSPDETEDWIVYHVKKRNDPSYDSGRAMYIKQIKWNEDGTPDFGTPPGYGEVLVKPSGEN